MTLEEARKVAAICSTADGRCSHCVGELCDQLRKAFPAFTWRYNDDPATDDIVVEPPRVQFPGPPGLSDDLPYRVDEPRGTPFKPGPFR